MGVARNPGIRDTNGAETIRPVASVRRSRRPAGESRNSSTSSTEASTRSAISCSWGCTPRGYPANSERTRDAAGGCPCVVWEAPAV
jgi:hypothetical protein